MSKIEDKSYLKRTRATWVSGKTGINYARAHAIMQNIARATPADEEKISKAIQADRVSPLTKGITKKP